MNPFGPGIRTLSGRHKHRAPAIGVLLLAAWGGAWQAQAATAAVEPRPKFQWDWDGTNLLISWTIPLKQAEFRSGDGKVPQATAVPADPHRHMLAIGISAYRALAPVPFASEAAQAVKAAGTRLLGVPEANCTMLLNEAATQGWFKAMLRRTLARLGPDDTLYFYYAGHGAPSREGRSAYLMPQDADEATFEEEDDLRMENLLAQLARSKARRIVVLLDACFSGRTGPQAMLFNGVAPVMVTPTSAVTDPERITLFSASEGNQFANEYRDHSQRLFTWHLVDALLDGTRDLGSIATCVREVVARALRTRGPVYEQTPALEGRRERDL